MSYSAELPAWTMTVTHSFSELVQRWPNLKSCLPLEDQPRNYGVVHDTKLGKPVFLKIIDVNDFYGRPSLKKLTELQREAHIADRKSTHLFQPATYDLKILKTADRLLVILVQEAFDARWYPTLESLIDKKEAQTSPILRIKIWIARQLLQAISHNGHNQLLHRDIKPANILVGRLEKPLSSIDEQSAAEQSAGQIQFFADLSKLPTNALRLLLLDPGISNYVVGDPNRGTIIGTPAYISNEMVHYGNGTTHHFWGSEVSLWGYILYEMLTGQAVINPLRLNPNGSDSINEHLKIAGNLLALRRLITLPPEQRQLLNQLGLSEDQVSWLQDLLWLCAEPDYKRPTLTDVPTIERKLEQLQHTL